VKRREEHVHTHTRLCRELPPGKTLFEHGGAKGLEECWGYDVVWCNCGGDGWGVSTGRGYSFVDSVLAHPIREW